MPYQLSEATAQKLKQLLASDSFRKNPGGTAFASHQVEIINYDGSDTGTVVKWDGSTWAEYGSVNLYEANGGTLTTDDLYLAVRYGDDGTTPVFYTTASQAGSGSSITVSEADGSPSVTACEVLRFDSEAGLELANPTSNQVDVRCQVAGSGVSRGAITDSSQTIAGAKTFTGVPLVIDDSSQSDRMVVAWGGDGKLQISDFLNVDYTANDDHVQLIMNDAGASAFSIKYYTGGAYKAVKLHNDGGTWKFVGDGATIITDGIDGGTF